MPVEPADRTPHLILGGAKSGKSTYAEKLAAVYPAPRLYVATAEVLDEEMVDRVQAHQKRRMHSWETIECPLELVKTLGALQGRKQAVLVDCLTLWLTNLLLQSSEDPPEAVVVDLAVCIKAVDYPLFLVSNEVGGGIVPDNALARRFRDLAGNANQQIAAACSAVTLVVAGLPLRLK
jgi:adenosylcobinamide kinase / adenosylcobinamide-phosphate guanylyltransferase